MLVFFFLLLLFSFQQVTALPLPAGAQGPDNPFGPQPDKPGIRPAHLSTAQPSQPATVPPPQLSTAQSSTAQPATVTSTQFINSPTGVVKQTCIIVLTPIEDGSKVQEVKNCTLSTTPTVSSSNTTESSSVVPPPATSTFIPTVPVLTSSSSVGTSPSSITSSSVPVSTSPAPVPTSPQSVPTSSSPVPTSQATSSLYVPASSSSVSTSLSSVPTSTSSVPTSVASSVGVKGASSVPAPSASASDLATSTSSTSGSAAAEQGISTDAVPGRKLSVLPIGLGVFAGISVIALIVVGLVTYERTKYRKAFRQRRLAESGAEMGYGGNAL